jgi:hypothetical protein
MTTMCGTISKVLTTKKVGLIALKPRGNSIRYVIVAKKPDKMEINVRYKIMSFNVFLSLAAFSGLVRIRITEEEFFLK